MQLTGRRASELEVQLEVLPPSLPRKLVEVEGSRDAPGRRSLYSHGASGWVMYDIALLWHRGSAPLPVAAGSQSGGRLSVVVLRYSDA